MKITCFIPVGTEKETNATVQELRNSGMVAKIYLTGSDRELFPVDGAEWLNSGLLTVGTTVKTISVLSQTEYTLIYARQSPLKLAQYALDRFVHVAEDTGQRINLLQLLGCQSRGGDRLSCNRLPGGKFARRFQFRVDPVLPE